MNKTASTLVSKSYGPLIADIAGHSVTHSEAAILRDPRVGGMILFARNFASKQQLCALTAEIHALREGTGLPKLLIAVDHEGGRVQRFKTDGFTHIPPMAMLGQLWQENPLLAHKTASCAGFVLAAELLACGVDYSFTPVIDLDYGASSVIGNRAFHSDASIAAMLVRSFISGLHRAGMRSCGKHFPGHGFVAADSHHEIPVDERDLASILARDAAPYAWLSDVLDAVMPAHVIYPKVDTAPAGFSRTWVEIILRQQLGFNGVVFSDDLSMAGATVVGDVHARARAALGAGCDMVLLCNSPAMVDELLGGDSLGNDALSLAGMSFENRAKSQNRIAHLVPQTCLAAQNWEILQNDVHYVAAKNQLNVLLA